MKRSKFMRNGRKARRRGTRLLLNIHAYDLHAINKQSNRKCINTHEKKQLAKINYKELLIESNIDVNAKYDWRTGYVQPERTQER
jgi:hypothetical protein